MTSHMFVFEKGIKNNRKIVTGLYLNSNRLPDRSVKIEFGSFEEADEFLIKWDEFTEREGINIVFNRGQRAWFILPRKYRNIEDMIHKIYQ